MLCLITLDILIPFLFKLIFMLLLLVFYTLLPHIHQSLPIMQDFIGSVRRSLVFKPSVSPAAGNDYAVYGSFVQKIGSSIRKSKIGLFTRSSIQALPPPRLAGKVKKEETGSQIRWRKGELIGCGAFGRVYMGMNLDSGELLAVKFRSL